jgi:hypothetical protein
MNELKQSNYNPNSKYNNSHAMERHRTIDSNSDQTDITSICKNNQPCSKINPDPVQQEVDDNNDITTPLEAP